MGPEDDLRRSRTVSFGKRRKGAKLKGGEKKRKQNGTQWKVAEDATVSKRKIAYLLTAIEPSETSTEEKRQGPRPRKTEIQKQLEKGGCVNRRVYQPGGRTYWPPTV